MKRIIYSLIIGAAFVIQAYAEAENIPPQKSETPIVEEGRARPRRFTPCEKCRELRKKAREERREKRKSQVEDGEGRKSCGPIFCDECKKKHEGERPRGCPPRSRKMRRNDGPTDASEIENGENCPPQNTEFWDKKGHRRHSRHPGGRGKRRFEDNDGNPIPPPPPNSEGAF